jgi:Flp pilus assembly protein TadG
MLSRPRPDDDDGSIMVLIIGYTAIAAVLIVVGIDVSKVFLAQRALAAAADTAALSATQGVDTAAIYAGSGPTCGSALPLAQPRAAALAAGSVAAARVDLDRTFASLAQPRTQVAGGTVEVTLTGQVAVPFGRVLSWLDPSDSSGAVRVTETSHAQSAVIDAPC